MTPGLLLAFDDEQAQANALAAALQIPLALVDSSPADGIPIRPGAFSASKVDRIFHGTSTSAIFSSSMSKSTLRATFSASC